MIDRIRGELEQRLDELTTEADKLRAALAALGPDDGKAGAGQSRSRSASSPRSGAVRASRSRTRTASATTGRTRQSSRSSNGAATARRGTKGAVLSALAGGDAMTASQVAGATGLGRATVSTTLSKM